MSPSPTQFITLFYETCCPHDDCPPEPNLPIKATHLIRRHASIVLESHVRPAFAAQGTHPALDKRRRRKGDVEPFYETQPWKERRQGDEWDAVEVLNWCVLDTRSQSHHITSHFKKPDLEPLLPLLVPPILTLIDDWEVKYKTTGVVLLRHTLRNINPTHLSKMGLGDVFFDAVTTCLTYVNDPDSHIPLLCEGFPCALELARALHPRGSEKYIVAHERVLVNGVLSGLTYAGESLAVRRVLLEQVEEIYEGLGAVGVRYLKVGTDPVTRS
ncbi:hypothetical protein BC938DRAFT_474862 [Jimgerdemannia flammicorona]|uniref:Uncharacterized protein n=1 Tax=Jimgerdemannia flammicorona TaxID=994334 RepID=A0A433QS67_9FUNG|nr:hypothetical protein BC938DRAFT_474862 [Jimgerdemannia flammicorona]